MKTTKMNCNECSAEIQPGRTYFNYSSRTFQPPEWTGFSSYIGGLSVDPSYFSSGSVPTIEFCSIKCLVKYLTKQYKLPLVELG